MHDDIHDRLVSLEEKAFYWDITATIILSVVGIALIRSLSLTVVGGVIGVAALAGLGWGLKKLWEVFPVDVKGGFKTVGLVIIIGAIFIGFTLIKVLLR